MANEISLITQINLNNGSLIRSFQPGTQAITQTEQSAYEQTVALTTTDTKLSFSGVTTKGIGFFRNISAAGGTINVGSDTTNLIQSFLNLKAGEGFAVRLTTGSTYRAQTLTGSATLHYGVYGD